MRPFGSRRHEQMTDNCKRVHFIGVGGVGMSGIARVAADAGMRVSGSDMK